MFDIGWSEILIVALIALFVLGPSEVPHVLRMVGRGVGRARRFGRRLYDDLEPSESRTLSRDSTGLLFDDNLAASPFEVSGDARRKILSEGDIKSPDDTRPDGENFDGAKTSRQARFDD